jgi:hypothetical protein
MTTLEKLEAAKEKYAKILQGEDVSSSEDDLNLSS